MGSQLSHSSEIVAVLSCCQRGQSLDGGEAPCGL